MLFEKPINNSAAKKLHNPLARASQASGGDDDEKNHC